MKSGVDTHNDYNKTTNKMVHNMIFDKLYGDFLYWFVL